MPLERSPVTRRALAGALSAVLVGGLSMTVATAPVGAEQSSYQVLHANLRPGGDPDGSGTARFRLYPAKGKVCARVTWQYIGTPNAAHIHRRSDGMVKIDLTGSVTGGKNCTTGVRKRLIRRILEHPRRYYFNVHNDAYPAGAIQGVLRR